MKLESRGQSRLIKLMIRKFWSQCLKMGPPALRPVSHPCVAVPSTVLGNNLPKLHIQ